jgi:Flp pilus assembly protein TadD
MRIPLLLMAGCLMAAAAEPVRVWQATLTLPSYQEGAASVNPPFDAFATTRFNYPYTLREELTDQRISQSWRALYLENEYLKCAVLPDIGGRLYSCTDKTNGAEMFYANPSIKKARVGYRGAWAAFGVEFNFPVSHNWVSMSPVDFALSSNPDGSASVWVGNIDRVYGMQWRVELKLRPGSTVLEERVRLFNRDAVRHRFYWWNNAAAEVWNDTHIIYPQSLTASHGFTHVDTWPVNQAGVDVSIVGNHTAGPVSQFMHRSREPYMGVYHPKTQAGTVHFAWHDQLPAKKIWSWGVDADGLDWHKALSDNNSGYVEIQGGLFRNQETYAFLEPQETVEFSEFWLPVREIGGFIRANLNGALNIERGKPSRLALNVTQAIDNARLVVRDGERVLLDERLNLSPASVLKRELPEGRVYTAELSDAAGAVLLKQTEGVYDMDGPAAEKPGPRPAHALPAVGQRTEGDWVEEGKDQELNGRMQVAWQTYADGLKRYPESYALHVAAGRLGVQLMRYTEALALLEKAQARISNDEEVHYYLGLALKGLGQEARARDQFEHALVFRNFRPAAALELARLAARRGDYAGALDKAQLAVRESPLSTNAGWLEVALLEKLKRTEEAKQRLAYWRAVDPTNSLLRLSAKDETVIPHLGAEPERVLEVATDYLEAGFVDDALALLDRDWPEVDAATAEPGAVRPQAYALIAYYRAWCRERLGQPATADYARAATPSTKYVFPSRPLTRAVLEAALKANSKDAHAHYLLGNWFMTGGQTAEAIQHWEAARTIGQPIPVLHRNLGLTLLRVNHETARAATVLEEGLNVDRDNVELYSTLDQALTLLGRPAKARVAIFERYPDVARMPAELVYSLILGLVEDGRYDAAEKLFHGRFFAREEGGTNVRQVYLEVRLQAALAAARAGRKQEAAGRIAKLSAVEPGLDFTKDGMEAQLADPRVQYLLGEAEVLVGQQAAAEKRWRRLMDKGPRIYGYLAAKKLNDPSAATRLEALKKSLDHEGAASNEHALRLREAGRTEQARQVLRAAVLGADRNLSLYLCREVLSTLR